MGLPRWVGRAIGLDVHRDFCEVAICEDGDVRSAGQPLAWSHADPPSRTSHDRDQGATRQVTHLDRSLLGLRASSCCRTPGAWLAYAEIAEPCFARETLLVPSPSGAARKSSPPVLRALGGCR
jgi:hypothetical protein